MDSNFFTYLDMITSEPKITIMSIVTEIILFLSISLLSIAFLIIPYKLNPVKTEYKKQFILFSIALILIFSLIYPRIPINPYLDYYLPFWEYIRPIIYVAFLSALEYLLLSSKKSSKKQLIKTLAIQGILILSVYSIVQWIASIIISNIVSSTF